VQRGYSPCGGNGGLFTTRSKPLIRPFDPAVRVHGYQVWDSSGQGRPSYTVPRQGTIRTLQGAALCKVSGCT
jgi:hypothetical protein